MKNSNNTYRYAMMHSALDCEYGIPLTARTDIGAKRQATVISRDEGLRGYSIVRTDRETGDRVSL